MQQAVNSERHTSYDFALEVNALCEMLPADEAYNTGHIRIGSDFVSIAHTDNSYLVTVIDKNKVESGIWIGEEQVEGGKKFFRIKIMPPQGGVYSRTNLPEPIPIFGGTDTIPPGIMYQITDFGAKVREVLEIQAGLRREVYAGLQGLPNDLEVLLRRMPERVLLHPKHPFNVLRDIFIQLPTTIRSILVNVYGETGVIEDKMKLVYGPNFLGLTLVSNATRRAHFELSFHNRRVKALIIRGAEYHDAQINVLNPQASKQIMPPEYWMTIKATLEAIHNFAMNT